MPLKVPQMQILQRVLWEFANVRCFASTTAWNDATISFMKLKELFWALSPAIKTWSRVRWSNYGGQLPSRSATLPYRPVLPRVFPVLNKCKDRTFHPCSAASSSKSGPWSAPAQPSPHSITQKASLLRWPNGHPLPSFLMWALNIYKTWVNNAS